MQKHSPPLPPIVIRAAWLYYAQGQRQEDIAQTLAVSRASVVNYLKQARDAGLVQVRIDPDYLLADQLGIELTQRFGLSTVHVASPQFMAGPMDVAVVHLCAQLLIGSLVDGDNLGVAWGRTVYAVAQALPVTRTTGITVTQLCGNIGTPHGFVPEACTMEIASRLMATCHNLYAPLVLSSPELARALRAEPVLKQQFEQMTTCTRVLFSVGDCSPDSHVITCGAMTRRELAAMAKAGASGVIVGRLIDAKGKAMVDPETDRMVAITLKALHAIPKRLMVVHGREKAQATLAALRGGYCTELVIDADLAGCVVELARAGEKRSGAARQKAD